MRLLSGFRSLLLFGLPWSKRSGRQQITGLCATVDVALQQVGKCYRERELVFAGRPMDGLTGCSTHDGDIIERVLSAINGGSVTGGDHNLTK